MHASRTGQAWQAARGFFPSGQFGIGYTGGAYLGYGATNTIDPFNIHRPKYKYSRQKIRIYTFLLNNSVYVNEML